MMNCHLTSRQKEVASVISEGVSNKDAANKLFVCEKTIKYHLTNIFKKFGVTNRYDLIIKLRTFPLGEQNKKQGEKI